MIILKLKKILFTLFYINSRKALINRVFPSIEHKNVLEAIIPKPRTVLDIGANCGQFTLIVRCIYPDAKIISFEPLQNPVSIFNQIFKSDKKVTLYHSAIGPDNKTVTIHVSKRHDSSSLLPISARQSAIFPGTEESHTEEIQVSPLNQLIKEDDLVSPVFVKIDVQGYELEVLKVCQSFFNKLTYIYCECSFAELYEGQALANEVIQYLIEYSFELHGIYNVFYDKNGIAMQGDFFFKKRTHNDK